MIEACENCPKGLLFEHSAMQKAQLENDLTVNTKALNNTTLRDFFNGNRLEIESAIAVTKRLQDVQEKILPDAVEQAVFTCPGPFERTTEPPDSLGKAAKWLEKVCGAEVAAQLSVSGMRLEQDFS